MTTDLTAAIWRKSSRSSSGGGQCVEVARNLPGVVAVRDSKNPNDPALVVDSLAWQGFSTWLRGR
jgi:uncharacterized protein DUF397